MSDLSKYERDISRSEKVRDEIVSQLTKLNKRLETNTTDMLRTLFATDRQFDASLKQQLTEAAKSDKETVMVQGGKRFTVSDIDPKKVLEQRELTEFESRKLDTLRDDMGQIATAGKAAIGTARREKVLLGDFQRDGKKAVSELKSRAHSEDNVDWGRDVGDLENQIARASAAERSIDEIMGRAGAMVRSAESAQALLKRVNTRRDVEDILTALAGGFGVTAAVAALIGSMGAAGILALPALVAYAASRLVKLWKQAKGD